MMRSRTFRVLATSVVTACMAAILQGQAGALPPDETVRIPISDGATLAASVLLPGGAGPFPTILEMTPYNRTLLGGNYLDEGYAHVNVDVRGTGQSDGALCVFCEREQRDAYEVVEWIAAQSWSDKAVGMIGGSYDGITSLLGAAQQPPHLKAIVPIVAYADPYRDAAWHNGLYSVNFMAQWLALQTALSSSGVYADPGVGERVYQVVAPVDALKEPLDGPLYRERAIYNKYDRITVPTLLLDGWFDAFARGAIWNFQGIAAQHKRLIIEPYGHKGEGPWSPTTRYADAPPPPGADDPVLAWFDRFLKEIPNGIENEPPMTYYELGAREWRTTPTWPPAGAGLKTLYLSGDPSGGVPSLNDGSLVDVQPVSGSAIAPDRYLYDPSNGVADTFAKWGELAATPQIPLDQRVDEVRALTYSTRPLRSPMTIAGPIELRFWGGTDASDTDWVVRVTDVAEDGSSTLMTTGYMRASHRRVDEALSSPAEPWIANTELLDVPNQAPVEYRVDVWHTAWTVQPGHRLRITISSSDVPSHQPLLEPARNSVFHDPDHPSRLILTVT